MINYIKFIPIVLASSFFIVFLNCEKSYAEKKYLIKFATVAPEGSTWVNYMRDLDKNLKLKSNGRLGLRIYAGGIAGDELDVLKKIRIGQLHCAAFSGVGITEILPIWRVMDLPFMFRNMDEVKAVHKELNNLFKEEFRQKGFEYVSWAEVGNVHLFSKREIKVRDDLKGLKIWTWSGDPISKKTFSILGSSPIPLAITDVVTAINTNMIDTVYAPPVGALAMQWHENMDYMTGLPITHSTGAILVAKSYFDRIPKELAELLKKEIQLSMTRLTDELQVQTTESIIIIKDKGISVTPSPKGAELQKFYDLHNQVANELKGGVYPENLLIRVNNILKNMRTTQ